MAPADYSFFKLFLLMAKKFTSILHVLKSNRLFFPSCLLSVLYRQTLCSAVLTLTCVLLFAGTKW
jgi:hypothetical protein